MRKIKFRAWDNLKKIWTNYKILDDSIHFMDKNTGVWFNHHHEEYKRFKLLQHTGLKDIAGDEIYEGDIVRDVSDGIIGQIEYSDGGFIIIYDDIAEKLNADESVYLEVVGNIFENPELLGEEVRI